MEKQNFYDLNFDQLKNFLIDKAEVDGSKAKMRSQQMFNAVYKKNIKSFDELTTFGLELREKIKNLISLDKPKIIDIQKSKDGTIKFLLELKDKRNVETVLIPDKTQSRYTICLSVSVGCYLSCEFCATAQISKKLVRNLTPGEIISQIILCKDYIDDWSTQKLITNQVLMGEGSPFLNLDSVKIAIDNSKNKDGLEYGRTRITVSTVGVGIKKDDVDAIEWAAKELDVYLAWSLHSSVPKHRSEIMPINDKYSIVSFVWSTVFSLYVFSITSFIFGWAGVVMGHIGLIIAVYITFKFFHKRQEQPISVFQSGNFNPAKIFAVFFVIFFIFIFTKGIDVLT
ncbi:hypothetical protein OAN16_01770, partial [Pelagibacteraceae bacterium]|nr:hypothetical protein [Pelagibacteraceae bacterium]